MHSSLETFEQVLIINDVAILLIVAIKPIYATDGLKQAMIVHLLIYIEISGRRSVKASEEFVYHYEEFKLPGLLNELSLCCLLELFDTIYRFVGVFVEPVRQHLAVGIILFDVIRFALATFFSF